MVSPVKQIWKDFSTGKGGNAITFLMEHEHYSYPEAIRYLAKKYNIEIEETIQSDEQKQQSDERESMYLVSEFAKNYFHNILLNSEKGKAIGLSYFKERGFSDEIIKKFAEIHNVKYELLTIDKYISAVYLVNAYPTIYLIKNGSIIYSNVGYSEDKMKELEQFIISNL